MYGHIYFEIHADDIMRAQNFYKELFGWKFERALEAPVEYWRIITGGTRGGMLIRPNQTPPPGCGTNAFVCSIEVDNFDKTGELILKNNGKVVLPKFAVPGVCWQGYFTDTENNIFGIFQPDETAA